MSDKKDFPARGPSGRRAEKADAKCVVKVARRRSAARADAGGGARGKTLRTVVEADLLLLRALCEAEEAAVAGIAMREAWKCKGDEQDIDRVKLVLLRVQEAALVMQKVLR